ncbi:MAG: hypothetical protein SA378_06750 [Sedimentibacter sp.]|uniref:hypothetical protein n=1 Tax=Sedimentibacter sp. TaxID=1960295 RepID=UPI002980EA43|nr:hypothetical protein [Sedimentibacter sp.]MDW5299816.1 hypothetical protein [Sedimentibacter sp.]
MNEYEWSSFNDYINENTEILCDKYINIILNYFKDKNEFIKFHSLYDKNLYIDTIEEEQENIQNIVQTTIEQYTIEKGITDYKEFTQIQKEELARMLINLNMITINKVAELCNLSLNKVKELGKDLKN